MRKSHESPKSIPLDFQQYILEVEGEYVDHPEDPGKATKYGITQKTLGECRKEMPYLPQRTQHLTIPEAMTIYYRRYYLPGQCHRLPFPLSLAHFDGLVHCGIARGVVLLQRCLNELTPPREKPLGEDGIFGPHTDARTGYLHKEVSGFLPLSFKGLLLERLWFYRKVVHQHPSRRVFLLGWLRRLEILDRWKS